MNNAAGTDFWLVYDGSMEQQVNTKIKTRASGGLGDIYIIVGEENNAGDVIAKYHKYVVGTPVMVPQWSFGWH
jgi:alpha-glucosidase (family GH31 glycosyl hydrolase)